MQCSSLAVVLLAAPLAAQTVHTVGASGAFSTIQAAVDAAADGDVVLIQPGRVDAGFVVDGKSLVVLGQSTQVGEAFSIDQVAVRVQNVTSGQRVVLRGLVPTTTYLGTSAAVVLANNDGIVWLEDVDARPFYGAGIVVNSCRDVVLCRSTVDGWAGLGDGDGFDALTVASSDVHLFDSVLRGGPGEDTSDLAYAGDGGSGIVLTGVSLLVASGCEIRGGRGGNSWLPFCDHAGTGGAGLILGGLPAFLHDTDVLAGTGGFAGGLPCGLQGTDVIGGGALTTLPGAALTMSVASPIHESTQLVIQVHGPPNVPAFLGVGVGPDALFLSALSATIAVQGPHAVIALGTTDAGGSALVTLPLPPLPPGLDASVNWGQSGYVDGFGQVVIGAPSALVIVDSAF